MRIDIPKTIYVLTAHGVQIDNLCEIHNSYESARNSIEDYVKESNAFEEKLCEDVWKTESKNDGLIEWEIFMKQIII